MAVLLALKCSLEMNRVLLACCCELLVLAKLMMEAVTFVVALLGMARQTVLLMQPEFFESQTCF